MKGKATGIRMNRVAEFADKLSTFPIIAILRGVKPSEIEEVCGVLECGGFTLAEVPLNSPDALESIRMMSAKCDQGCRLLIGAGTVVTEADVVNAAAAGARYIVSPDTNPEIIRASKARGLVSIPGFMTPTEGVCAIRAGADYLKCFPCGKLGAGHIQELKAVIKKPILAVGGVSATNLAEFLSAADGVGVGSELYKPGRTTSEIETAVRTLAAAFRKTTGRNQNEPFHRVTRNGRNS